MRAAFESRTQIAAGGANDGSIDSDAHQPTVSELPKSLNRNLTLARTRAIRRLLAGDPDTALALCVASAAATSLKRTSFAGLDVSMRVRNVDDLEDYARTSGQLTD